MFDHRKTWLDLTEVLFIVGLGLTLAFGCGAGLACCLREVLPPHPSVTDTVTAALVLLVFVLWGPFALAIGRVLCLARRRRETAQRALFDNRPELTDGEFIRLFPEIPEAVALRRELQEFSGRAEVVRRFLPADPVRATCELAGLAVDDLDWANFLGRLEARFGIQFPDEVDQETTVAELVKRCGARQTKAV